MTTLNTFKYTLALPFTDHADNDCSVDWHAGRDVILTSGDDLHDGSKDEAIARMLWPINSVAFWAALGGKGHAIDKADLRIKDGVLCMRATASHQGTKSWFGKGTAPKKINVWIPVVKLEGRPVNTAGGWDVGILPETMSYQTLAKAEDAVLKRRTLDAVGETAGKILQIVETALADDSIPSGHDVTIPFDAYPFASTTHITRDRVGTVCARIAEATMDMVECFDGEWIILD